MAVNAGVSRLRGVQPSPHPVTDSLVSIHHQSSPSQTKASGQLLLDCRHHALFFSSLTVTLASLTVPSTSSIASIQSNSKNQQPNDDKHPATRPFPTKFNVIARRRRCLGSGNVSPHRVPAAVLLVAIGCYPQPFGWVALFVPKPTRDRIIIVNESGGSQHRRLSSPLQCLGV
jgi:hypothetical protein